MFTGIIEAIGSVETLTKLEGGRRLRILAPFADEVRVDESVAVNGTCLTVVAHDAEAFEAIAIEETLAKTSLGDLEDGSLVNLERAMRAGGRLDGHIVQGHVDATGTVESVEALDDSWLVRVHYPEAFAPYLIPVGSIALDGISLTVARLADETLTVAIIPHTWDHTTVHTWTPGRRINLEFDLIGKYVVRALERGIGQAAL